jgi:predicted DNA-binding protein (MmcQ/YjbR family)
MNTSDAVRKVCLSFPEAEEVQSHGSPDFRVRGKTFATYVINHHGDGRVALWLNAPAGAQEFYTRQEPKHFFVPPYVGPRGWLGVHLNKGMAWKRVAQLVREAYEKVAPPALANTQGKTLEIKGAVKPLSPAEIDPLQSPRARSILKRMREICLDLPEANEAMQFGSPVWRAGKKTFAQAYCRQKGNMTVAFWVGVDRQRLYVADARFSIPPYMGHNGWIALDVAKHADWQEIRSLAVFSYRHFAGKKMLRVLESRTEV